MTYVPRFVLMTPSVRVSRKLYTKRIVVVETNELGWPKMVSPRAKNFVRIVKDFGHAEQNGRRPSERARYEHLTNQAKKLIEKLNEAARIEAKNEETPDVDYD